MKKSQDKKMEYTLHYQLRGSRQEILSVVFSNFDLDSMRERLQAWLHICLTNDYGGYDTGEDRKMLMSFCEDFERIIEAFYIESKAREKALQMLKGEARKLFKKLNKCVALSKEERENTLPVLIEFAKSYKKRYVRAELLCMLESVIICDDDIGRERFSALTFFQCVNSLVGLIYNHR